MKYVYDREERPSYMTDHGLQSCMRLCKKIENLVAYLPTYNTSFPGRCDNRVTLDDISKVNNKVRELYRDFQNLHCKYFPPRQAGYELLQDCYLPG